ncbi:hypothetical protein NC652_017698 [Populus alba x Populus x berolinensis]|nr:hypothetical protein NC652_017697 [Populus alba x Populus x berolinensis]KAJ6924498.1 hypothetical protein NC652_017698 [Populus alba x Populus x berolinensis]
MLIFENSQPHEDWVNLDSIDAIKLIKDDVNPFHKYSSIVLEIKEMTTRMWQVDPRMHSERVTALQIILRKMQQVAEWLYRKKKKTSK